jgi:xanthine/uracil permease
MTDNTRVHPIDEQLPLGQLIILGLQHVLVMYAGAVAVPLILGGAMKLPLVADKFFQFMPNALSPLLHSGILLASISAVVLNLYFNGMKSADAAAHNSAAGAANAEAG